MQGKKRENEPKKRKNGGVVPFDQGVTKRQKLKIIEENVDQILEEKTPQPFIAVRVGKEEIQTYAFIDSRADGNTIFYELYTKLQDAQLMQTNAVFQAYTSHKTKALGCCELQICRDKFFVTQGGTHDVPIILGTFRTLSVSYDGPKDTKRIDLTSPGEESKPVHIATTDLRCLEEESKLIKLLLEFRDVFAWS